MVLNFHPAMAPSKQRRRIMGRLDDQLPMDIDRRNFLAASAASLFTTGVAGCLGDDDDDVDVDAIFRQPWLDNTVWAYAWIAGEQGYWDDAGIDAPDVQIGDNSPDTLRRVGTTEAEMGHGDWASTVSALAEDTDLEVIGNSRNRMILSFFWVEDRLDGHDDLEGADVALASPFAEVTWPVYPHVVGQDPDVVGSADFAEQEVVTGMLEGGDVDAVWGSLQQLIVYEDVLDLDFGAAPLGSLVDVYGYPMFVNPDWIDDDEDHYEYAVSVLEAYSEAQRWGMLNPDEVIDIMVNDVNPELAAQDDEITEENMRVSVTLCMGQEVLDNGLGNIDTSKTQETLDTLGEPLVDDLDALPDADELVRTDVQEDAELATFDDDEYAELESYTGRWNDFFLD